MKTSLYAIASFFSLQSKKLVIPAFLILSSLPSLAQPTVTDVTEPINWPYTYNATLTFKVTFSETVTVSGFPYLAITLNSSGTPVQAGYRAGSGTNTLTFQYIIRNGDFDDDGITMDAASALNLNGGSIKNGSGANALLPLSGLDPLTGIRVDAVPPVVTGVTGISGAYGYGQEVLITVHFSEPVDVSGTPELGLNVFGRASYVSGTGTTALVFKYIVAEGDAVADLDYYSFGSLTGGSLVDAGSNAAIRALPVPGTAGSLGANANIVIEALTPVTQATGIQVSALTGTSATLSWTNGSGNRRAVFMKAASSGSAVPQNTKYYAPYPTFGLGVEIGTTAWYCVYNGTGTTINVDGLVAGTSYRVMVTEYNNGSDGAHYNTTAAADNPISFTTSSPPAVISITEPVDWMYLHTSLMTFTVTFNEDVTVSGLPYLAFTMNSSGTPKHAVYKEGSGTNTLTFEYSVEDGDSDDDGITMNGATALNLDGGSIKNNSNMDARLPLSGLDPMTGVRVDGIVPVVTGVTGTSGLYRTGGEVLITVHFSEPVNVGGTPMLGLADALAAYVSGSGTTALVFKYTVATGDAEADLDYYSSNSIAAGTLEDVNGNPANRFLPAPGAAGSLGANADIVIDAITPVTQASDIQVASVTGTTALLSWTNGSGSRHAVFMKAASSGTVAPENSESYFPHSTFGMGTLIVSTGWFCVYNDIGTTVSVNGLTTGTTYQVMVVDYNSGNGSASYGTYYNTSTAAGNPASFTTLYAPAGISLSATAINENVAAGSAVGTFTATDAEGGAMVYTLVGGTGSSNNSSFTIDGDVLKINASPDYETKASYSIRVRVTDNSLLTFEKQFTITINDLPEANVTVSETSLPGFTACAGSVSSEQSFSVSGTGLTAGLVVTAPDGFEVSATSGSGYSASVSLTPASGAVSSTAIYIRTGTLATGTPSGNVTVTSTGAADHNIAVSATVNVSTTADGSITNTSTGRTYCSIQAAIDDPLTLDGHTISLGAGNYIEDVLLNKSITLQGAGSGTTTIYGAIGGQASTILIQANNIIIEKLGIARQGNTVADWNNPGLNTAGIQITGQSYTNTEIRNCRIAVNRTGIDINNSSGHSIHNNIIGVNRIGIVFRNQTENISVVSNSIVDNWAVGILFLDGSGGTNSPVQSAAGSTFSNNTISGNWYGQVIDRQAGGNLPDPGTTNGKDFRCNDFGTPDPIVTTANSAEPGYASQIPFVFGGPATAPGGQPDIAGPASANILYTAKPVISTGVLTLCAGGSVTLTSSSATGNQWYLDGSPVAGATDQTYGATIAGNYTVIVTDGCTWPASDAVTVTASPEPEITLGAITPVSGTTTSFTIPFTGNTAVSYALNASSSGNAMTGFVPATGNLAGSSIDVTIPASASGTYDFVLTIHTADNCSRDYPLSLVVASPSISAGTIATPLSATYGAPSVSQSFAVSGTDMNEAILVTAPAGFEVSLDDNNYSNTVTVGSAGVISSTTVYTRIKEAINAGPLSGDVVLSAAGAGDVNVGVSGVVHPAPLTITANDAGKIYGEELTGASGSAAFAATGLQYGETVGDVTITYGNGGAASDAAGTYSGSVVASDITGGTFNSANYTITYTAGQITVDPKAIIITAEAKNKAYGDNDPALTYTHSPELVTGDVFSGSLSRDPGEDVGTYTINQNTLALSSNYTITYNNAQLTIGARAVTVTAEAKSKAYGDSDPALTYTYSPELATGDAFTGSLSRDPGENGGNYAINQNDLALSSNYTITYNSANLAIGAKTITVTAEAKSKTYGASDPSLTYTYSPELATGDAFTGSLSRDPGEDVGGYAINQNDLALSPNYTIAYNSANLAIGAKTITVTAEAKSKTYGASDPSLTYTYSPELATGDAFSGSLSRDPGEDVGDYSINQNTLALSDNYTITYNSANFTIGAKAITVTADTKSKTYGASDPALTYTHSPALETGDAFTGSLSRDPGEDVGDYSINQNTLALSDNYTITYNSANLTIGAKAITVTADAKSKTYGASDPALTYTHSPALETGDAFTGSLSRDPGENVGDYTINQNTLALSPNYTIAYNSANLAIGAKTITVTADAKTKTYGASDPALTYTHSPELATGDAFSGSLSRDPGEDVGNYAINQSTLTLPDNYTITYNSANLAIGAKVITVTADAKSKTYGASDPSLTYTYSPELATGDAFSGSLSRDPGEDVGTYAINQNALALSSNYIITYNSANLTIGAKAITVTADAKSKTYGVSDPSLTYTYSPELATGDSFTGSLSRDPGENVGNYAINQNTLALSPNYTIAYNNANLTIGAKAITVTADAKSKTYGASDPALTYTYSPELATGDAFTGSLSRDPGENVGTYVINQNTLALSPNYTITYNSANLAIGAKAITVTVDAKSKTYGASDPALTYTYSPELATGDAFTGSLSRDPGENVGTYVINQNTLALSPNYTITYNSANLAVGAKAITVTVDAKSKTYGASDPALSYTHSPALETGDAFTGSLSRDPGENVGDYTINQHTLALSPNYTIDYNNANLTIGAKTITVTAEAKNKTYGASDPALTYTHSPALATGDAFTGSLSRDPGENVGYYTINQNTLALSPNYTIAYNNANLAIGAKVITVTADAKSKTYGASDPALTYTHSPALTTGDAFSGSLSRDPGEDVGAYAINQNTLALSPNYTIAYNNANLTIGAKAITVTADAKSKTYGASDPALTYTHSPALATGDAFSGSLSRDPGENVGTYVINQNTLALSPNYTITYNSANLAIGAKAITVTADAKNKTYGASDPALTYTHSPALAAGDAFTGSLSRDPGENVGGYAINQNDLALSPNYTITYNNANLIIGTKVIAVTADAKSKTYGASDPALSYTHSPALATGDAFTGALSRVPGEDVGGYAINQNTLALSPNYTITYNSASLAIGAKAITVTADAKTKTYGATDPALTYTYNPALITGDAFTGSLSRVPGENAGVYTINQNTLALSPNYTITYNSANLAIGAKAITVTADAKTKVYGATDPALTYTFSPALVTGDGFTGSLSRMPGENAGVYVINQNTLALSSNYILTYTGANLTIDKRAIAVTADAINKTYGAADPALTYTYTPALAGADVFTGALSRVPGDNVGVYAINQNSLALSSDYILTYTGANLVIGAKPIVVAADTKTKVYGTADPVLTYTYNPSLIAGDAFSGSLSRTSGENIGGYTISQGSLSPGSNYLVTYAGNMFTITAAARTLTFNALPDKTYGDPDFGPGAGVNTGETISYTSSNPAVATIVGGRVHITGAGNTVITASVAANANYTSNPVTSQTLVVNKAAQTIVFTAIPVQMKGAQYSLAGVTASSGLPVTLSSADPQIAVIQGPTLLAQRLGTTTITASQPGNANYLPAATVIQTVTVADAAGDQIQVRPALSPNGDGVNDFLYIEGIRNYADNKVTLINRNGVRIFEIKGYDNATRVFTGQSSITRQKQPAGTYFYLIEYTVNGERKQKTGFIVLKY